MGIVPEDASNLPTGESTSLPYTLTRVFENMMYLSLTQDTLKTMHGSEYAFGIMNPKIRSLQMGLRSFIDSTQNFDPYLGPEIARRISFLDLEAGAGSTFPTAQVLLGEVHGALTGKDIPLVHDSTPEDRIVRSIYFGMTLPTAEDITERGAYDIIRGIDDWNRFNRNDKDPNTVALNIGEEIAGFGVHYIFARDILVKRPQMEPEKAGFVMLQFSRLAF